MAVAPGAGRFQAGLGTSGWITFIYSQMFMKEAKNKSLRFIFRKFVLIGLFAVLTLLVMLQITDNAHAAQGNFEWANVAGGDSYDEGNDITVDGSGNSYVTGEFYGTAAFGTNILTSQGGWDVFVAKYDESGNLVWAKSAGGLWHDYGNGISVDASGNVFVIGNFNSSTAFGPITLVSNGDFDTYIAKYDNNGNVLWAREAGGSGYDESNGITVDVSDNVLITGSFEGTSAFGSIALTSAGSSDVFVAKYDNDGNIIWAKSTGGTGSDVGKSLKVNNSGEIYITGSFIGSAKFDAITLTSAGSNDIFIAKYGVAGNVMWAQSAGGSSADWGLKISLSLKSNDSYITGYFQGTAAFGPASLVSAGDNDIFTAKFDNNGNTLWAKGAGSVNPDSGNAIAVDGAGNAYVIGSFKDVAAFGTISLSSWRNNDIFVSKYDINGEIVWAEKAGGTSNNYGNGITVDNFGNLYLTGRLQGTASFGSTALTSSGNYDIFVAKYKTPIVCAGICNPSFEDGLYFWEDSRAADNQILNNGIDGLYSLYSEHILTIGENPAWSGVSQSISSVEPEQAYNIHMWLKSLNSSQGHIKIKWYNSAGGLLRADYPVTSINGTISSWTWFNGQVTSPADTVSAELFIWHGINNSAQNVPGSTLWVDNINMELDLKTTQCGTLCNENFEQGLSNWRVSGAEGSHSVIMVDQYEGLKSIQSEQMYTTGEPAKWAGLTQFAQVKGGTAYRLRVWLKTQDTVNGHIRIRWRDDEGNLINTQYPIAQIDGAYSTWFKKESIITAPANVSKAEITIFHGVNSDIQNVFGSTLWIDDITLVCQGLCNAGFEDGNIHWKANGKNESRLVSSDVHEGTRAISVAQNLGASYNVQWAGISQRTLITGGDIYDLSFSSIKKNTVQGHVKIKWRDANDYLISQHFPITGINGTDLSWKQLSVNITAPANAENMEIFFLHGVDGSSNNVYGSTLWLDNINLKKSYKPALTILEPEGVEDNADQHFTILWEDDDFDDDANISFFYDTDTTGEDGVLIAAGISEDGTADFYIWDTSSMDAGNYYIYGIIDDGINSVTVYNNNPITVMHVDGYSQISSTAGPSDITITTTDRVAGAIHSLTWNGKEFVNSSDHGRQIQSAIQFNNFGECMNPTEAGSMQDGAGPTSSSILKSISTSGNTLTTDTQMAFWLQPGQTSVACPALGPGVQPAQNKIVTSETRLVKNVKIGFNGMPHVIEHLIDYILPSNETYSSIIFEALTGYMPNEFTDFYTYDPATITLTQISPVPAGEQPLPVIIATPDQNYAMGVFSPDLPDANGMGYGKFVFPSASKWNCVFRKEQIVDLVHSFRCYMIVGTIQDVTDSIDQLYRYFGGTSPDDAYDKLKMVSLR